MQCSLKVVIVGNGMVGQKLVELLHASERHDLVITILAEEPRPAYDRVHLSAYFSGRDADDLALARVEDFAAHGSHLHLNTRVTAIDRDARCVFTASGESIAYDHLILATGSYPFVPPIPGKDTATCHVYRTIEDLEAIQASARDARTGVVVGGGLLGLEAAKALRDLGLETHVVEFAPRLMAVQIDEGAGQLLRSKIEALGVRVHTQAQTQSIVDGATARHRMLFADGQHLDTDLILFSAGIRPRDELARQAGLVCGERGGIVIDDHGRTSDPHIYAIGECALWGGRIYGLVAPGYRMAEAVAAHLLGHPGNGFQGADMSTKLKLLGVDVASIGDAHAQTEGARSCFFIDEMQGIYKKIVIDAAGRRLLGAVLLGDTESYGNLLQMMLNDLPLPERPGDLIATATSGNTALGVDALPDTAIICSCNHVSKADIITAVRGGVGDLATLKTCCKAASSCGGCATLATQVMHAELKKMGVAVRTDLCEHFSYSRQELFHLIRVEGLRSFDELLRRHGHGSDGCDLCKPVAASIFASTWNQHLLDTPMAGLQDSNDYFLANLQRDGSYSVVPRMPAGEVTPAGLLAIADIAQRYQLYTKITGGQRVDLFGARVDQLPAIWAELIAAGFESGHAYGKAVRTVKSCVGSTWCRYGVQDSLHMAVTLENRYRGIRSPHKLKMAVSGCTRECAEAQSKDIGVIATDKGWNLYVCGNGGMKPRHAELLVGDLDDARLLQLIDRFIMFYIRTADRLQRTSVWREQMEGGLDYLRAVVVDDALGLAAELEADMQHLVDSYRCEWKATLESPEKLARFRHFINSEQPDEHLAYTAERGQRRPLHHHERHEQHETINVDTHP